MKGLERGDYSSVKVGRYPHRMEILRPPSQYEAIVQDWRKVIENQPKVMNRIAENFFPEGEGDPSNLTFRFHFAGKDGENNRLILRYFAVIRNPFILAGYQVQFVFHLPSEKFAEIYVAQIPLE